MSASLGVFEVLPVPELPYLSDDPDSIDLLEEALMLVSTGDFRLVKWAEWQERAERFLQRDQMERMEADI